MVTFALLLIFLSFGNLASSAPRGPLTDHFQNWLIANGYESDAFDRPDIGPNGSFGGKLSPSERLMNEPVIFIHGTGDAALHTQSATATGWSRSIQYFIEQNYSSGELYATSWGGKLTFEQPNTPSFRHLGQWECRGFLCNNAHVCLPVDAEALH
jgi:hypothetical protein